VEWRHPSRASRMAREFGLFVGRISRDPLGDAEVLQGPNLYQYCINNPTLFTDPDGRVVSGLIAAIVIGGMAIGHVASMTYLCITLHDGEEAYVRTTLTIGASLFSGAASSFAIVSANGPAIYMLHVWKDNCGNCHTEWVIVPTGPSLKPRGNSVDA